MDPLTPETDAVQAQVDAYNSHDLKWFVACYAQDATIVDGIGRIIAHGHDEIRNAYAPRFARGVHADIVHRTQVGQFVVDEERVAGIGERIVHAVAVYRVVDGEIVHVTLLRDF
jgi:hypothetical protein